MPSLMFGASTNSYRFKGDGAAAWVAHSQRGRPGCDTQCSITTDAARAPQGLSGGAESTRYQAVDETL